MSILTHDGYIAEVELDEDAGILHGQVINTTAVLTFQGKTVDEVKKAFVDTIEDYVAWCKERGKEPEKPYSGRLMLRLSPALHRRLANEAARQHKSLNALIAETLERVA